MRIVMHHGSRFGDPRADPPPLLHFLIQVWLFGYELPDIIIVLAEHKIVVIGSKKKVEFLSPLASKEGGDGPLPPIELLVRNKQGDNDDENFTKVCSSHPLLPSSSMMHQYAHAYASPLIILTTSPHELRTETSELRTETSGCAH